MSYLTSYATRSPPVRGRSLDERIALNLPGFHGDAYVRVFVEDTTFRKWRRPAAGAAHPLPDRRLLERDLALVRARLTGTRQNSMHKIDTLLGACSGSATRSTPRRSCTRTASSTAPAGAAGSR